MRSAETGGGNSPDKTFVALVAARGAGLHGAAVSSAVRPKGTALSGYIGSQAGDRLGIKGAEDF